MISTIEELQAEFNTWDVNNHNHIDVFVSPLSGCAVNHKWEAFIEAVFPLCGCSDTEIRDNIITTWWHLWQMRLLQEDIATQNVDWLAYKADPRYWSYGDKWYIEMILQVFDNNQLTEHGTSVRCSWLTQKGRAWAEWMFNDGVLPEVTKNG